jgi:hypothetical protein
MWNCKENFYRIHDKGMIKMKRITIALVLAFTILTQTSLQAFFPNAKRINASYSNEFSKKTENISLWITYDKKTNIIKLFIPYSKLDAVSITLTKEKRKELFSVIDKYKNWRSIATKNDVDIHKKINTISLNTSFKQYSEWNINSPGTLTFYIYGKFYNDYQLHFDFSKLTSNKNEYITYSPKTLYLSHKDVLTLESVLSNQAITDYIKQENEKKNTEALFQ